MANRSFDLVDLKVAEAEFFLKRLRRTRRDFFAVQCHFSAFVSAARSVTYSLQAVLSDRPGFKEWYESHQTAIEG